ncbi:hypothetical protein J2P12_04555 [Candidatus Bathyarchaeota archaeon]|nr:hypothetical protein [Candidatus Bathyarchaeota archaeon]
MSALRINASRRRVGGRGVEAFFSRDLVKRRPGFLIGLLAIVSGCTLWMILVVDAYLKPFSTSIVNSYSSLFASAMGLTLVISGAGICTTSSIDVIETGEEIEQIELEKRDLVPNGTSSSLASHQVRGRRSGVTLGPSLRYGIIAFIQSCLAIAFYSGLAADYKSNLSMQIWVQASFPAGRFLLSWEAVLFVSALFGLAITQFAPGRAFAE